MHRPRLVSGRRRFQLLALTSIVALGVSVAPATAAGGGTKTSQPAMMTAVGAGITVTPLITVGETAGDAGYVFESVPDGIAVRDVAGAVPLHPVRTDRAQLAERLRQRPGQQAHAPSQERRGVERGDGDHE